MTHKTKRTLVFIYIAVTALSLGLCIDRGWRLGLLGFSWAEVASIILWATGQDAVGYGWAIAHLPGILLALGFVAAPICGCFRVYWPFKALLGIKALLLFGLAMIVPGWLSLLVALLHAALFVLTMVFFGREVPENATEAEIDDQAARANRLYLLQKLRKPGDGFANRC